MIHCSLGAGLVEDTIKRVMGGVLLTCDGRVEHSCDEASGSL